jgi:hypothetical protein
MWCMIPMLLIMHISAGVSETHSDASRSASLSGIFATLLCNSYVARPEINDPLYRDTQPHQVADRLGLGVASTNLLGGQAREECWNCADSKETNTVCVMISEK